MAGIETRRLTDGTETWRVSWRLDGTRTGAWQSITVTDSRKGAEKVAAMAKAHDHRLTSDQLRVLLGGKVPQAGESVAALCRRYVESLEIEHGTRREYERSIRLHIAPTSLGQADLAAVTREHVRRWIKGLVDSGAAPKSVANHHGLLFAAFNEAVNEGKISLNPCRGVRLPRRDHRTDAADDMCFLTPQEVESLAKALPSKYAHIPWLLALTGLRWSEFTALQVGDVDLLAKPPRLTVRRAWKRAEGGYKIGPPKSKMSRRTISLDAKSVDLLLPLVMAKAKREFVITTDGVKPLPHPTFRKAWTKAVEHLNAEGVLEKRPTIHSLRHTQASWLLDDPNVTMIRVQRRLGHESLVTTEGTYGHLRSDGDEAVLAALDGLIPSLDASPSARIAAPMQGR